MIYVGIDVSKNKHDCFIVDSNGEVLFKPFTIANSYKGFEFLLQSIKSTSDDLSQVQVGLESTGHYSGNILNYLVQQNLKVFFINPLRVALYKKGLSLRKTKTDKIDCQVIASMLMSNDDLIPYTKASIQMEELKYLTRYRYELVRQRAMLKQDLNRLVCTIFPELEELFPRLRSKAICVLLSDYPSTSLIASLDLTELTDILQTNSYGRYREEKAIAILDAAKNSIGLESQAKSFELKHTLKFLDEFDKDINELEEKIKEIMDNIDSPIMTIPGINYTLGAMIIAEIGDFNRFSSPDKILAFAGLAPTTYESGKGIYYCSHMEKRGSRYLRYALYHASISVSKSVPTFVSYYEKKRNEKKHYYTVLSHVSKKLIRVIYHLEKTGEAYKPQE